MVEPTFLQLRKNCKKDSKDHIPYSFALLGNCATQHLSEAIQGYAYEEGYRFKMYDAGYNQLDAQVLDGQSELYAFAPKSVLIYMCSEKLYEAFCNTPLNGRANFAQCVYDKISGYWSIINQHIKTNILQFTFVQNDDRIFGNFSLKTKISFAYQLQKLNLLLSEGCQAFKNVYLIDLNSIQASMGRQAFYDDKLYYLAKMPISLGALPAVAKAVLDTINAINGRFKKCAVLDLDNTLWGGVIGDDGLDGIQIGELGLGTVYTDIQRWLKELKNRGIILAVCSKNEEKNAKEPFLSHPDMILRLDDFSMFVANWEDKATNIKNIAKTLNIGMDSMVFLDDNPFERDVVRRLIPEITVPDLPEDPAQYLSYIKSLNLFETASYSEEDQNRTEQYRAEAGRAALQQQFASFDEYLQHLNMTAFVSPFLKFHYPRIAQLTQRSNQFNLRTGRYTEAEIEAIANDERYITLSFCLKDKFGDHGLVGVVILEKREHGELFIREWLMSCRVLKRGMEEFIINSIIDTAKENGFQKVIGEYLKTAKNEMVENIYGKFGFIKTGACLYTIDVNDYTYNKTYIVQEKK